MISFYACVEKHTIFDKAPEYKTYEQVKALQADCNPLLEKALNSPNEINLIQWGKCQQDNKNLWKDEYQILDETIKAYFQALEDVKQ